MTTPKEAVELKPCPFCGGADVEAVDSLDFVSCQNCGASLEDSEPSARELWNNRATPSLQGEDAVERVARIMVRSDPNYCTYHMPGDTPRDWKATSGYRGKTSELSESAAEGVRVRARAILAAGPVPDEAAIRADEREKCDPTTQGEAFYLAMYRKDGAIWDANEHKDVWINKARDYERRRAAAIRSGGTNER